MPSKSTREGLENDVMAVQSKTWIVTGSGNIIFGSGRLRMLRLIDETGSMNQAAKAMKMSYRALWGKVHATETVLGCKLIETGTGRGRGAGSRLTLAARTFMDRFEKLQRQVASEAEAAFTKLFDEA